MKVYKGCLLGLILGMIVSFLSGCGYFSQYSNLENSRNLRVGLHKNEVLEIMGEPLDKEYCSENVWYYYIHTRWHDMQKTEDECMPLVFRDDVLIGWGPRFYATYRLQGKNFYIADEEVTDEDVVE